MYSSTSKDDIRDAKTSGQNVREEAREDLRATANRAGRKVREFLDTTTDELRSATDTVSTHIHEKPVESSLFALALGFVLGVLFRR